MGQSRDQCPGCLHLRAAEQARRALSSTEMQASLPSEPGRDAVENRSWGADILLLEQSKA